MIRTVPSFLTIKIDKSVMRALDPAEIKNGNRKIVVIVMSDPGPKAFVVYLASHDRPMHELLDPKLKNIHRIYDNEFAGMTVDAVAYEDMIAARDTLIETLRKELTRGEREFLVSLKAGQPKWNSIGIEGIENLPAVQWKLMNIKKISEKKQTELLEKLRRVLEM